MSAFPPPIPRTPLARALQTRKSPKACLSDFPALALAATATTAELDPHSAAFASVMATLETLGRLRLSASSARVLMRLAQCGTLSANELAIDLRITAASLSGHLTRLSDLALLTLKRSNTDRHVVLITATPAAHKVLASIIALTALGAAASVLTRSTSPH